jgi:hypothetical protein
LLQAIRERKPDAKSAQALSGLSKLRSMPCRSVATWGLTALHVAAFAELGVLTRVYLDKLFQVMSFLSPSVTLQASL